LRRGHQAALASSYPRRAGRAGSAFGQLRARAVRRKRLRGAQRQLPRQQWSRRSVSARDLRRLGGQGGRRPARRSGFRRGERRRRSRPTRHRRLELWRHSHRHTTATTRRFKAAIAGAGSALQTSMYGVDEYVYQYDNEVGPPWKSQDLWIKISYPFFHADRITTPTLYLGGDKDFNVPVVGGEQMYQALRSLGVPTELIIYPGEHHGISRPSFVYDRYERYVNWYDKYLKPAAVQAGGVKPN